MVNAHCSAFNVGLLNNQSGIIFPDCMSRVTLTKIMKFVKVLLRSDFWIPLIFT